jgi:hypothetical protein
MTKTKPMTLEDICVSLDLAKQLKEAGYPQRTIFCWAEVGHKDKSGNNVWEYELMVNVFQADNEFIAAPTTSEIGEKLKELKGEELPKYYNGDWFFFVLTGKFAGAEEITSDTEANARAKMWLYLKKEGLL